MWMGVCVVDLTELGTMAADLRSEGNDLTDIEVKKAAGGFPSNIAPTPSAFANIPGGGTLLFGLEEANGFASVGVYDVAACKAALANVARQSLFPPVTFEVWDLVFEGPAVVIA